MSVSMPMPVPIADMAVCLLDAWQVCADPGAAAAFVPDAKKAVGGHVLAHIATTRVMLRKGKGEQRIAKMVQHPCMPADAEAVFEISNGGVGDCADA